MSFPSLVHHGGASGVTGSCHQLFVRPEHSVLVDCGLFQGNELADSGASSALDALQVRFPLDSVRALVVTHVHIDHVGRLPYLLAAGFRGPIICSLPSAKLLPLVIEDALKIGFTRDAVLIERFLQQVESQLVPLPYKQWHTLLDDSGVCLRVKLNRAGHILGSAYVQFDAVYPQGDYEDQRVVFSGDLGAPWSPLLPAPRSPYRADLLVLESTYGDRLHENRRVRVQALKRHLLRAVDQQGCLIIPAFSIGRTQELLYELEHLVHGSEEGSPLKELEVIVDSPLAARFTQVYRELKPFWDAEARRRVRAGRHPLSFETLYTVDDHVSHQLTVDYLCQHPRPAVVIAASGMASGGRVVNYLKAMLPRSRNQVLFVGYQAKGTPGADILRYGPDGGWVLLDGERVSIQAQVGSLSGYSAHADQRDLVRFASGMRFPPGKIRLVHGDEDAQQALKRALQQALPESLVETSYS